MISAEKVFVLCIVGFAVVAAFLASTVLTLTLTHKAELAAEYNTCGTVCISIQESNLTYEQATNVCGNMTLPQYECCKNQGFWGSVGMFSYSTGCHDVKSYEELVGDI